MSYQTPASSCPSCGTTVDASTSVAGDHAPSPGDVSICMYCGHLMAFADDLTLRPLTDKEMLECAGDMRILRAQRVRLAVMKQRRS